MAVGFDFERTFIGWGIHDADPVSARAEGGKTVCRESWAAVSAEFWGGVFFGPGLSPMLLLMLRQASIDGLRFIDRATTSIFLFLFIAVPAGWAGLNRALFQRRSIVFDPETGRIDLYSGSAHRGRLFRKDVAALELRSLERTSRGLSGRSLRWTGHLVAARLSSGKEVLLFESPQKETVRSLHERLRTAFF